MYYYILAYSFHFPHFFVKGSRAQVLYHAPPLDGARVLYD